MTKQFKEINILHNLKLYINFTPIDTNLDNKSALASYYKELFRTVSLRICMS